ncbi:sulfatase-like hydrolase/transferase [Pseudomonadota bacterium]
MRPSNLLILMSDEHNKKFLGCYGHPQVKTPNLDRLAAAGTRFSKAYTNSPICVPARASLATGRYTHDIGYWDNAIAYDGRVPSWGHRLQQAGNPVTSIGKLHYRFETDQTGFDEQVIPMHIADGKGDVMGSIRPDLPVRYQSQKYADKVGPGHSPYLDYDRDIAARAADWLKNRANNNSRTEDRPWVLFVSFICPHFPLIAPPEYYQMYPLDEISMPKAADRDYQFSHPWWKAFRESYIIDESFRDDEHRKMAIASYLGLCTFNDDNIGTVLSALEDSGMADNTRVTYFSDHGDNMGARELWGKSNMYEESAGIPLILAGPDIPRGKVSETAVSLVDIFPTVTEAVGLTTHADDVKLPGRSLIDIANENDDGDRLVFSEYHAAGSISGCYLLRRGKYKYVNYIESPAELFDLEADPEELKNLSANPDYASILNEFEALLRTILDPEAVDAAAKAAQAKVIEENGGREAVVARGGLNGTPVPGAEADRVAG